jgi:hypothetical protein
MRFRESATLWLEHRPKYTAIKERFGGKRKRGRSLEGSCQEGRAIFFIFFCQAIHIANAATICTLDFVIFGCSLQCSAPDAHLDQGRSERKSVFSRLEI